MSRCLALVVMLALVLCALAQRRKPEVKIPEVDQRCMECICQASSDCKLTAKCHNDGGNYFCGPYVITWPYWHDAGSPGDKGGAHDFETCLNDKTCAERTVRGYMRKYGQDCDKDGVIDCYDFARIHKLGYGACGDDNIYNGEYWQKFEICYDPSGYERRHDVGPQGGDDYGDGAIQARQGGNLGYN